MTEKRTVFITGGAGFIGLHVVEQLLDRDWKVRIFDNMWRGDRDRAPRGLRIAESPHHAEACRCRRYR